MITTEFDGKVVLITGAGSGFGRATALTFARAGATVVVADILPMSGEETVEMVRGAGGTASFIQVDVADSTSVQAMVATTVQRHGRLDCAFNNAGVQLECNTLADLDEEIWDKTIAVNQKSVFLCMKYEIQHMLKQGGGAIVNTASIAGVRPLAMNPAYTASKFGVVALTRYAAVEYAKSNIRINAICPGTMRTPMLEHGLRRTGPLSEPVVKALSPLGEFGEAQDIADAALWLCSDKAKYVYGALLAVDGGFLAA